MWIAVRAYGGRQDPRNTTIAHSRARLRRRRRRADLEARRRARDRRRAARAAAPHPDGSARHADSGQRAVGDAAHARRSVAAAAAAAEAARRRGRRALPKAARPMGHVRNTRRPRALRRADPLRRLARGVLPCAGHAQPAACRARAARGARADGDARRSSSSATAARSRSSLPRRRSPIRLNEHFELTVVVRAVSPDSRAPLSVDSRSANAGAPARHEYSPAPRATRRRPLSVPWPAVPHGRRMGNRCSRSRKAASANEPPRGSSSNERVGAPRTRPRAGSSCALSAARVRPSRPSSSRSASWRSC